MRLVENIQRSSYARNAQGQQIGLDVVRYFGGLRPVPGGGGRVQLRQAYRHVGQEGAQYLLHKRRAALRLAAQARQVVERLRRHFEQGHHFVVQHLLIEGLGQVVVHAGGEVMLDVRLERIGGEGNNRACWPGAASGSWRRCRVTSTPLMPGI